MEPEIKMDFQLSPCSYIGVIINTSLALGTRFILATHYTEANSLQKAHSQDSHKQNQTPRLVKFEIL